MSDNTRFPKFRLLRGLPPAQSSEMAPAEGEKHLSDAYRKESGAGGSPASESSPEGEGEGTPADFRYRRFVRDLDRLSADELRVLLVVAMRLLPVGPERLTLDAAARLLALAAQEMAPIDFTHVGGYSARAADASANTVLEALASSVR